MRKTILLFLLLPWPLVAQSVFSVAASQCVWHAGDNPAWAAASLDESGWQPYSQWKANDNPPQLWVRCHADLSSLQGVAQPAVQDPLSTLPHRLSLDGQLMGGAGNLHNGNFSINAIRSYPRLQRHPSSTARSRSPYTSSSPAT